MILVDKEWDDRMFMIAFQDIPQSAADNVIRSVQKIFSEDDLKVSYHGNIEKGDIELTFVRSAIYEDGRRKNLQSRHDITKLCAFVCQTIGTLQTKSELLNNITYVIFDGEFPYELFNCMARRLKMITDARKNQADVTICATCGNCPCPRLGIDHCNIWSKFEHDISVSLNRELSGIDLGDLGDGMRFISPKNLICEFTNLDNFVHMLTIEQLIDVYNLI